MSEQKNDERYILAMLEQIDTQQRKIQALEQFARDALLCLKDYAPMLYEKGLRARALQDRAAELGIIPELGETHGNK